MDIKLLKQYIANKAPKKQVNEIIDFPDYVVVSWSILSPPISNSREVAVLIKWRDGFAAAGVGKTKEAAIAKAIEYKADTLAQKKKYNIK